MASDLHISYQQGRAECSFTSMMFLLLHFFNSPNTLTAEKDLIDLAGILKGDTELANTLHATFLFLYFSRPFARNKDFVQIFFRLEILTYELFKKGRSFWTYPHSN
jgi:hypothetical protein